jgi:cation transport ATPase
MASAPPQNSGPTQMATRIDTLPLRTDLNNNIQDIDDPIIQNVLQEFENEMANSKKMEQPTIMQNQQFLQQQQQQQHPVYHQQMMQNNYQQMNQHNQHNQHKQHKKLLDSSILQKTFIITIIVFFLLNYNVMHLIISKMPDVATSYISGREFIFNFVIIFGIFYSLTYFDIL